MHELTYSRLTSDYYYSIFIQNNTSFEKAMLVHTLNEITSELKSDIDTTKLYELIHNLSTTNLTDKKIDVSIIIPVYKVEEYLDECILSVLNQINPPNLEIICVDDGSPDRCGDICDNYSKLDSRVITIHKKNGGLSSARNAGVQSASGKYLYFLDSDDMLRNDAVRTIYDTMEKYNLEVLVFDAETIYETPQIKKANSSYLNYYCNRSAPNSVMPGKTLMKLFNAGNTYRTPVQLMAINRQFYHKHNLSFYNGILHEDNLFTFICLLESSRTLYMNDTFYYRRIRSNSIMTTKKTYKNYLGYLRCLIQMELYYKQHPDLSEAKETINNTARSATYVYNSIDQLQRNLLRSCNFDELIMSLSIGVDILSGSIPYANIKINNSDTTDYSECIKSLKNQSIPINIISKQSNMDKLDEQACIPLIEIDMPIKFSTKDVQLLLYQSMFSTDYIFNENDPIKIYFKNKKLMSFTEETIIGASF